jgi:putative Holliday junction resolvase
LNGSFEPGKRLAFDVGKVRVGVASCDRDGILPVPLETLDRQDEFELNERLRAILEQIEPIRIYVGLPNNLQNQPTGSTDDAVHFARLLSGLTSVPIWLVDERLSTRSAAAALKAAGRDTKSARRVIDQQAAVEILDTALSLEKQVRPAGVSLEQYGK